jgi:hypothetical protein
VILDLRKDPDLRPGAESAPKLPEVPLDQAHVATTRSTAVANDSHSRNFWLVGIMNFANSGLCSQRAHALSAAMTYVLQLAEHTDLPVQTVLRVLLRQPTNEAAEKKVAEAVALFGLPDYPRPDGHIEVLPSVGTALESATFPAEAADNELEPADPTQELVTELRGAVQQLLGRLDRERRERIDDLALSTDLFIEGWQSVDRRLGRLEKIIERIDQRRGSGAEVRRLENRGGSNQ